MKNKVLKLITYIMALIFIVSVCFMDSISNVPFVLCCISMAWLGLFAYANRERLEDGR